MEATGGAASRKPGRAPLLSPGRQISMEREVITPPRGGGVVPNPFPNDFPEDSLRDGDLVRQKDIGSPVDMLVNTVARMQKDIATLLEENRLVRTPAVSQAVQATVLASGGRRAECCSFSTAIATAVSVTIGGRTNGPLWIAGSTGRQPETV